MMTGYWRSFWQLEVTAMHPSSFFFFGHAAQPVGS